MSVPGVNTSGGGGAGNVWSGVVACAGTGYCAVLGSYNVYKPPGDISGTRVFVWSKTNGVWQPAAVQLPGLAGTNSIASALSCSSTGNCTGGGYYVLPTPNFGSEAFVVDESRGVWGKAHPVPGIAALNKAGYAEVTHVSCGAPGYCTAVGFYTVANHITNQDVQFAFLASEVKGRWGAAHPVPGLAATGGIGPVGGVGVATAVSCSSPANCAVVVTVGSKTFVLSEWHGIWGKATRVAGTTAGPAALETVSCDKAGDCAAGGSYTPKAHATRQAFVVTEKGGRWSPAHALAGYGIKGGRVESIDCPAAGYCAAVGEPIGCFTDGPCNLLSGWFTADEVRGTWQQTVREPTPYSLFSVSCSGPGNCTAAGLVRSTSTDAAGAAVATETSGKWGGYQQLPGEPVPQDPYYEPTLSPVSCGSTAANCAIWGYWANQYGPFNQWVSATTAVS
jgi:hypothetical protein